MLESRFRTSDSDTICSLKTYNQNWISHQSLHLDDFVPADARVVMVCLKLRRMPIAMEARLQLEHPSVSSSKKAFPFALRHQNLSQTPEDEKL